MTELLKFIFSNPMYFIGTIVLIMVLGISIDVALSPFKGPRSIVFNGIDSVEVEDDESEGK